MHPVIVARRASRCSRASFEIGSTPVGALAGPARGVAEQKNWRLARFRRCPLQARFRRRAQSRRNPRTTREAPRRCCAPTTAEIKKHARLHEFIAAAAPLPEATGKRINDFLHSWSKNRDGVLVPGRLVCDSIAQPSSRSAETPAEITTWRSSSATTCGSARTSLVFQTRPVKTNSGR